MRLARIGPAGAERPVILDERDRMFDLSSLTSRIDGDFLADDGPARALAALGDGRLPAVAAEPAVEAGAAGDGTPTGQAGAAGDGTPTGQTGAAPRIGAPINRPGKIVCVGLNFSDHAAESGATPPSEPVLFFKAPNAVVGPNDTVLIPRASTKTDYEVELGVVIGRVARYLESPTDASAVIAGYVISNDVSEREFQLERGGQWDKGKSCETFNPLGPWLVTPDEVGDPQRLGMRLWVNGDLRQDGHSANMIFDVPYVIWYLSQFMVLEPGDLVNTGTPAGVAMGTPEYGYLRAGDVMELEIDRLGRQRQVLAQA